MATEVGFSETAFVAPAIGFRQNIRYFSPEAEVSFCGHATIAAGVVLGRHSGDGTYQLRTSVGMVPVSVGDHDGRRQASLTSVTPAHKRVDDECLAEALDALNWKLDELDTSIPPVNAYAGAWHLVLAVLTPGRLATLDYDFDRMKRLMVRRGYNDASTHLA